MDDKTFLQKLNALSREIEQLKQAWLQSGRRRVIEPRPSLYGSVRGGDITEEMIDDNLKHATKDRIIKNSGEVETF